MKNMAYAERVSLGEMEKRLPPQFVRCHKSYIINIVYVDSIVGSLIYMADGTRIVAGRKISGRCKKRTACVCTEIGWNTCPEIT